MTPRERILASRDRGEPDPVPIDLGSSIATSRLRATDGDDIRAFVAPEKTEVAFDIALTYGAA